MEDEDINLNSSPGEVHKKIFKNKTPALKDRPFKNLTDQSGNRVVHNTGFGKSKYDKDIIWDAEVDDKDIQSSLNEHRAQKQSGLEQTGFGLLRTTAKVATEVAKLPFVIGGLVAAPFAEENQGLETAFNNRFIKFFDSLNEDIKEQLPVYTKKAVDEGGFMDHIGSSAFWASEGADGLGFMLSMLVPGGVFKALGGSAKLFGGSVKALQYARFGKGIEGARKAITATGLTINKLDNIMIPLFNTVAESGAEAKGVSDDLMSRKKEFIAEQIEMYGQTPEKAEELFNEQKALAMQNTFNSNLAILAIPNYLQAKLLFGKTPSKVLLDKVKSEIGKTTVKNTVLKAGKRIAGAFASEGSEEVAQTSTEHRNVEKALNNKLGKSFTDDYNLITAGEDFIRTLGTTEGQIAGFLGGILGSPISVVGGYKQDLADTVKTAKLREKINGQSSAFRDIYDTDIYEQEEYLNPETNEKAFRPKEFNGKKVIIPENVVKMKKALDLNEGLSERYDKAVEEGDLETIEKLKKQGEFNLITNFIGENKVTLDALNENLKTLFPVVQPVNGEKLSPEQLSSNLENKTRADNIIKKATQLQTDLVSFKDMSTSLIKLNNPESTETQVSEFLNNLAFAFISERSEEFDIKEKLDVLIKQRAELEKGSSTVIEEILNPNFVENITSEFDRTVTTRSTNPRLELLDKQIKNLKEELKSSEKAINSTIWDNKFLNKQFNNRITADNKIKENFEVKNTEKADEIIKKINSATTVEELNNLPKVNEDIDKVIQEKVKKKKEELKKQKEDKEKEKRKKAKQEDEDFNTPSVTDIVSTEGSVITDVIIPKNNANNTVEELKDIENGTVDSGKGVKVISADRETGEVIPFIEEFFPLYMAYERTPVNKKGNEVGFQINQNPGKNPKVLEALTAYNKGDFSNIQLLLDYLPINVQFTPDVNAPIETKRKTNETDPATQILRESLIFALSKGVPIENITTTIQDQYKGLLKVESDTAENNLLDLDGVTDSKYIRDNLHVINIHGELQNIITGKTTKFKNLLTSEIDRTKNNGAGEIYLMIPQANGTMFPLKLNIKKLSNEKAIGLADIYKEMLINKLSYDTTISEVSEDLRNFLLSEFKEELKIVGGNQNDIKLSEIVDLLVYESENIKSQIRLEDGVLYYGDETVDANSIEENFTGVVNFLTEQKRHQIKISPKSKTDNKKTNIQSNSSDYLNYLVENKILSTNAVVNEPTFQGYSNIYLNTLVKIEGLAQAFSQNNKTELDKINKAEQEALKPLIKEKEKVEKEIEKIEKGATELQQLIDTLNALNTIINKTKVKYQTQRDALNNPSQNEVDVANEVKPQINTPVIKEDILDSNQAKIDELEVERKEELNPETLDINNIIFGKSISGFHGGAKVYNEFRVIPNDENTLGNGVYFFPTDTNAKGYAEAIGGGVSKATIALKKPFVIDFRKRFYEDADAIENKFYENKTAQQKTNWLVENGYDGVINIPFNGNINNVEVMVVNVEDVQSVKEINTKYDAKIKKLNEATLSLKENKSDNTRNSNNNSVSLPNITPENISTFQSTSDIPGTVENIEKIKTQTEVFKASTNPREKTQDIKRMSLLFNKKINGTLTKENEIANFENFKNAYPNEYKKICK
jgi:hypothetical protein